MIVIPYYHATHDAGEKAGHAAVMVLHSGSKRLSWRALEFMSPTARKGQFKEAAPAVQVADNLRQNIVLLTVY